MADVSGAMVWKLFEGVPRVCDFCGKALRVQNVGEHRAWYEKGKRVREAFWCVDHRGGRG